MDSTEGIKIGRNCKSHRSFKKIIINTAEPHFSFLVASAAKSASDWTISVQNKLLMPDPHTETGSQDVIVINATESLVSLHDVTALRFILRQPSPNWKTFNVEEIAVSIFIYLFFLIYIGKNFELCISKKNVGL